MSPDELGELLGEMFSRTVRILRKDRRQLALLGDRARPLPEILATSAASRDALVGEVLADRASAPASIPPLDDLVEMSDEKLRELLATAHDTAIETIRDTPAMLTLLGHRLLRDADAERVVGMIRKAAIGSIVADVRARARAKAAGPSDPDALAG